MKKVALKEYEEMTLDGEKTIPCLAVLRLMDSEFFSNNYCETLNVVLDIFPEVDHLSAGQIYQLEKMF